MKKPLIVIIGPTATGKSDLAVEIALRVSGEVISADSRQVYRGLNIGTGKITQDEMRGVPHHLIDVEDPQNTFTVADYKRHAEEALETIYTNGNIPILAGGTGLYVDAIVSNLSLPEVPPNPNFRSELSEKTSEELYEILASLDIEAAKTIDRHNPRRLVRAIEIIKALGHLPPLTRQNRFTTTVHYLDFPDDILRERINTRLDHRLEQGMIEEGENLLRQGVTLKRMRELGLEYRFLADYLEGKITKDKMRSELQTKIWQYAKRQRTWFRKYAPHSTN